MINYIKYNYLELSNFLFLLLKTVNVYSNKIIYDNREFYDFVQRYLLDYYIEDRR